jgi:hypothetical protein
MRSLFFPLLLSFALVLPAAFAQDVKPGTHAPDGNVQERFMSIIIPPKTGAPFTSMVRAEWTRTLEDGSTMTTWNRRVVARDSAGRIFQERRTLVPTDGPHEPELMRTEISDPATHMKYFCFVWRQVCELQRYEMSADPQEGPAGEFDGGKVTITREDMGKSNIAGVDVNGTREILTYAAGVIGNDRPLSVTKEIWYSPALGLNLMVKRSDPRYGTQTISVSEISLTGPDPRVFTLPAGYRVVNHLADNPPTSRK